MSMASLFISYIICVKDLPCFLIVNKSLQVLFSFASGIFSNLSSAKWPELSFAAQDSTETSA